MIKNGPRTDPDRYPPDGRHRDGSSKTILTSSNKISPELILMLFAAFSKPKLFFMTSRIKIKPTQPSPMIYPRPAPGSRNDGDYNRLNREILQVNKEMLLHDCKVYLFKCFCNTTETHSHCLDGVQMGGSYRDNEYDHHLKSTIFLRLDDRTQSVPYHGLHHFC